MTAKNLNPISILYPTVLAIESSGKSASIALLRSSKLSNGQEEVGFCKLEGNYRTASELIPKIKQLVAEAKMQTDEIDLIATTNGPGSFTGLRIGVVAAKTMAYALECQIVGCNSLRLLAFQFCHDPANFDIRSTLVAGDKQLVPIMDAQRNQLFVARFGFDGEHLVDMQETDIVDREDFLTSITHNDIVIGSVPSNVRTRVELTGAPVADERNGYPRADALARLASLEFQLGNVDDIWNLEPNYFRKSAAEEKADAQGLSENRP